jgi:hypothetical protein
MMSRFKVKQRNTKLRKKGLTSSLHINDNCHRIVDENNNTIDREPIIENVIQRVKEDKEQQKGDKRYIQANVENIVNNPPLYLCPGPLAPTT